MTGWDGTGIDPWLPHRLAAETTISTTERNMYRAWWASFSDWLVQVQRSVMAGEQPDPNGVWSQEPDWLTRMSAFVQGPVRDTIGLAYETLFGPGYRFDARPAVTTHLAQVRNRMAGTPETVYDTIAATIARGAGNGDSIPDIASRVSTVLTATGTPEWANRATTVARTEAIGALSAGRSDAYAAVAEELGEPLETVWVATLDARVRPSHFAADGLRVPVGQPFIVGGEPLMYPGDPSGSAHNVINCRCSTLLELVGETTDMTDRGWDGVADNVCPCESGAALTAAAAKPRGKCECVFTTPRATREDALAQVPKVARKSPETKAVADYRSPPWFKPMNNEARRNWAETEALIARDHNFLPRGVASVDDLRTAVQQRIATLDGLMARSRLKGDAEVWRGTNSGDKIFGRDLGGDLTGLRWREEAFVSTSARRETAQEFAQESNSVLMRIKAPAGSGAVEVSGWGGEAELLLERGQTFEVVTDHGVDPDWGCRVLDVEVVTG